jgi:hypothetical protein
MVKPPVKDMETVKPSVKDMDTVERQLGVPMVPAVDTHPGVLAVKRVPTELAVCPPENSVNSSTMTSSISGISWVAMDSHFLIGFCSSFSLSH